MPRPSNANAALSADEFAVLTGCADGLQSAVVLLCPPGARLSVFKRGLTDQCGVVTPAGAKVLHDAAKFPEGLRRREWPE